MNLTLTRISALAALALALPIGLAACRSETKVYNTPSAESGTVDDVHTTKTKERVHVVGEPDDPKDHDQDRIEMRERTRTDVQGERIHHDTDKDVDTD